MPAIPATVSLDTSVGPEITAGEHNTNNASIMAAINGILALYAGGSVGDFFTKDGASSATWGSALAVTKVATAPAARVYRDSNQTIPNGGFTYVQWTDEVFDQGGTGNGLFDLGSSTTQALVQTTGLYLVIAHVTWALSSLGTYRQAYLEVNGNNVKLDKLPPPGTNAYAVHSFSVLSPITAGQSVRLAVAHDIGSDLDIIGGVNNGGIADCSLDLVRIGG